MVNETHKPHRRSLHLVASSRLTRHAWRIPCITRQGHSPRIRQNISVRLLLGQSEYDSNGWTRR